VTASAGGQTTITTLSPSYSGYVYVSASYVSATTGYIRIYIPLLGTYTDYIITTGSTITAPVTAAYTYYIMLGNSGSTSITATLSGTYYPSSSSSTGSTTLFSSQTVTANAGGQTTITTLSPGYSGYVYVSASYVSATTGYIRIYNYSSGTYTDYIITTGSTVTAPVYAGYTYYIMLGNLGSTSITATLSGTYYYQ